MEHVENNLATWIIEELERRDWSQRKLAKEAGLSHTQVSNVLAGNRNVTFEFCQAVATAFGESTENVMRVAGLLPPLPSSGDQLLDQVVETFKRLPMEKRKAVLEYAHWQYERYQREQGEQHQKRQGPATAGTEA